MLNSLIEGFTLGLSAVRGCLTYCIIVFLPYILADSPKTFKKFLFQILQFLTGRLASCTILALLIIFAGIKLGRVISPQAEGLILLITAIFLGFFGIANIFSNNKLAGYFLNNKLIKYAPFVLGMVMGSKISSQFIVAVARVIGLENTFNSILYFLAFFAGASIYVFVLLFIRPVLKFEKSKFFGQLASLLAGIYLIITALSKILQ